MAIIEFTDVSKIYPGGSQALHDINLKIENAELLVLVGPSGCGKSTALRLLAGLDEMSYGEIRIDGRRVNELTPQQRNVAMVFQNYSLYPHMTVRANLEFPLKVQGYSREEISRQVERAAEMLGLTTLLKRKPKQLSGGQSQRVAMGRAIVRNPSVFLMDEPLSNLDAKLRVQIRRDILALQHQLAATTIYVTHDQVEAMTLGQRVAVLSKGKLQQVDTPAALYSRPANVFVAEFIGSPGMNLIQSRLVVKTPGHPLVLIEGQDVAIPISQEDYQDIGRYLNSSITLGIRPEGFAIQQQPSRRQQEVRVMVDSTEQLGHETLVYFSLTSVNPNIHRCMDANSHLMVARLPGNIALKKNQPLILSIDLEQIHLFNGKGKRIGNSCS